MAADQTQVQRHSHDNDNVGSGIPPAVFDSDEAYDAFLSGKAGLDTIDGLETLDTEPAEFDSDEEYDAFLRG